MKKLLVVLLTICMVAGCFTACGKKNTESNTNSETNADSETNAEVPSNPSASDEIITVKYVAPAANITVTYLDDENDPFHNATTEKDICNHRIH